MSSTMIPKQLVIACVIMLICTSSEANDSPSEISFIENTSELLATSEERVQSSTEPFIPEKEWKPIHPGQSIPPGLHVRLDLTTGVREAKLLGETVVSTENQLQVIPDDGMPVRAVRDEGLLDDRGIILKSELENALKKIDKIGVQQENDTAEKQRVSKQFRSMDELKTAFAELNLKIQSEREIVKDLIAKYHKRYDNPQEQVSNQLTVLTDLEFYVHQIDSARDFVNLDGLLLIKDAFNSMHADIRAEAALALGAAAQSNPKVQIAVLENGFISILLDLLRKEFSSREPDSEMILARVWYALSGLLRNFPLAQKLFLRDGSEVLAMFLNDLNTRTDPANAPTKVQRKVITLVNDLLTEKRDAKIFVDNTERTRQYSEVDLLPLLIQEKYCHILISYLSSADHDLFEKVLDGLRLLMELSVKSCNNAASSHQKELSDRIAEYQRFAIAEEEESVDDYFSAITEKAKTLFQLISTYAAQNVKNEL